MSPFRPFLIALQFLTCFPIHLRKPPSERDIGRSALYYPLVGLLIGFLLVGLNALLEHAADPLRAALLLAAWVLVTGALHLDGLADSADALVAGRGDRERTLMVLKDPYCGPMGATALVVILLVKYSALIAILEAGASVALATVPVLARAALPLLFLTTPYVRPQGLGSPLAAHLPSKPAVAVIAASAAAAVAVAGMPGIGALMVSAALFLFLRALLIRRIGGTTGDTAGALVELTETVALATFVLLGA